MDVRRRGKPGGAGPEQTTEPHEPLVGSRRTRKRRTAPPEAPVLLRRGFSSLLIVGDGRRCRAWAGEASCPGRLH